MEKIFNITGNCRVAKHYMADVSKKLAQTFKMVERGDYFIINRPRQYGKTTTLFTLSDILRKTDDYLVLATSFEGIGDTVFETEKNFSTLLVRHFKKYSKIYAPELLPLFEQETIQTDTLDDVSDLITALVSQTDKKVVLMIDEVDKSSNNQLFISFLAMLRNKYLESDIVKTFHSIVLAGVHDVKSLKLKIRPDEEAKFNSPWNIAADFTVDMNLQVDEIKPMLDAYVADKGVQMDTQALSEKLFYYTSGYPFLVSKLCKMLDETYLPQKTAREWTEDDLQMAVQQLVKESNTNFDTLVKNLENSEALYQEVYRIVIDGDKVTFNAHNTLINFGILYGIFVDKNGTIKIHNRIYNEVIANYMASKIDQSRALYKADFGSGYKNDDKSLNMEAVLLGFQAFMKKEYSKRDRDFLEKNGRLVFLAFLKPIINGSGYDFKEVQVSEEKRLDVVITYLHEKFVAELKLWYGQKAHEKGLVQLAAYLDTQALDSGYLLIFDHSEVKNWHSEWIEAHGKKIFTVWV